jgi:enterochelin esterase-like enzyme
MIYKTIIASCLLLLSYGCKNTAEMKNNPDSGQLQRIEAFPSSFVEARTILVWLPSDYNTAKEYAVVYMHDGQMLFDSTITWTQKEWKVDETMARLTRDHTIMDAIVVGIPNSGINRWAEYIPEVILDSLPDDVRQKVVTRWLNGQALSDRYLRFIITELKPYIDQHYATKPDQANTFIMGSSMGGIISLYAICAYPDVFGGAACLSTHWPLNIPGMEDPDIHFDIPSTFHRYLAGHLPEPAHHKIYFDYGTETLDTLYKPYQARTDSLMIEKGYTTSNWKTEEFPGEEHTEVSWARRLHIPLTFLLGK